MGWDEDMVMVTDRGDDDADDSEIGIRMGMGMEMVASHISLS